MTYDTNGVIMANLSKMIFLKRIALTVTATLFIAACGENSDKSGHESDISNATASASSDTMAFDANAANDASLAQAAEQTMPMTVPITDGDIKGTWGDIVYGSPDAKIEIIEYASTTCPHCATFANSVFPRIKEKFIDTGDVRFIYRNFILNRLDLAASAIARCGNSDQTLQLMKSIFARQNDWARSSDPISALAAIARRVGLSRVAVDRCLADTALHKHLVEMTQTGQKSYNVNATPTIILDGQNLGSVGFDKLSELIEDKK